MMKRVRGARLGALGAGWVRKTHGEAGALGLGSWVWGLGSGVWGLSGAPGGALTHSRHSQIPPVPRCFAWTTLIYLELHTLVY